jgi:hypothetical protein
VLRRSFMSVTCTGLQPQGQHPIQSKSTKRCQLWLKIQRSSWQANAMLRNFNTHQTDSRTTNGVEHPTAFIGCPFRLRFQIWLGGKCNRTLWSSIARRATIAVVSLSNKGTLLYLLCDSIRSHYWISPGEWRRLHCIALDATSHI